ncbi:hypothetical protein BGZ46_010922 [Entomortierella lignicola]|nr:hypothetical protein BGZ46_010922 [Entomortierella lignicola]
MTSAPPTYTSSPPLVPKAYSAPSIANLPYHQRPLPPGWASQFDPVSQAYFYIDERTNPPTITWEDPRPAYYIAQERGQYAPPPPGVQGRNFAQQMNSPIPQPQQQVQQQSVHTVQNSDGTVTTITSTGQQPIHIHSQSAPQQQQQQIQQQPQQMQTQQQQSSGPSLGRTIVGAAVVSSLLRPRTRVVVAPRRRRF